MVLPIKKKETIFNEILKKLDIYNNSDDIEILKNITNSCLFFSNNNNNKNLYGIEVLFNKIINIDEHIEKNEKEKNNIENIKNNLILMLEAFEYLLSNPKLIKSNVVYSYLDRIFEIIKEDKKNNILCIIMISKIFNEYFGDNLKKLKEDFIKNLDEKYDIITLLVNSLINYINNHYNSTENNSNSPENKNNSNINNLNKFSMKIYSHENQIKTYLNIIFSFLRGDNSNYILDFKGEEHLVPLYLNLHLHEMEYNIFLDNLNSMEFFENETLIFFHNKILQNFDYKSLSNQKEIDFILNIFKTVNEKNNKIFNEIPFKLTNNILINKSKNFDMIDIIYNILINNNTNSIISTTIEMFSELIINLYEFNEEHSKIFWENQLKNLFSIIENNKKNHICISNIIKLIEKINKKLLNFKGKIPEKEDYHQAKEPNELYHFYYEKNKKKEYKIKVNIKEKISDVRWRIAYYYDLFVNNIVFKTLDGKKFSLINNDNEIFVNLFPKEK
jgi:hypothetical protein